MKRTLRLPAILIVLFLSASAPMMTSCDDSTGVCCRVCREGKACGDSCIAKDKQCNAGPGCACNG